MRAWVHLVQRVQPARVAAAAWCLQGQRHAMNSWLELALRQRVMRAQLERGVEHLRGGQRLRAFNTWVGSLSVSVDVCDQAARRWKSRGLSRAWVNWVR